MDSPKITLLRQEPQACQVHIDVEVPQERVAEIVAKTVADYRKKATLPGFRKGKAPTAMVRKRFEKEIKELAKESILREVLKEIAEAETKDIATFPHFENMEELQVREDMSFVCSVEYDVQPEFELPDYKNLSVDLPESEVTDESVDEAISDWLNERAAVFEDVDRPAEMGDQVQISFEGRLAEPLPDGEELSVAAESLLHAEETWLGLRSPSYLPGLPEQLVGMAAGDERTVTVQFPDDYFVSGLAGKSVEFTVKLLKVQEKTVPELTDEYAKSLGAESADDVRQTFRDHLETQDAQRRSNLLAERIREALLSATDFPLPPTLVKAETYETLRQRISSLVEQNVPREQIESRQEALQKEAEETAARSVKWQHILQTIAEKENLGVSDELLESAIAYMARRHQMSPAALRKRLKDNGRIAELQGQLLLDVTFRWLVNFYENKLRPAPDEAEASEANAEVEVDAAEETTGSQ